MTLTAEQTDLTENRETPYAPPPPIQARGQHRAIPAWPADGGRRRQQEQAKYNMETTGI